MGRPGGYGAAHCLLCLRAPGARGLFLLVLLSRFCCLLLGSLFPLVLHCLCSRLAASLWPQAARWQPLPQSACQPRAFERAFPQLACQWPLRRGAPQLSWRARPPCAYGTRLRNVEDALAAGCSDFQLWFAPSCRCERPFPYAWIFVDPAPNELARPAPLCAGERMARQQIWIALQARSRGSHWLSCCFQAESPMLGRFVDCFWA